MPRDAEILEGLLADARWLRRISGALTRDDAEADDLAQEAWLAAAKSEGGGAPSRPWLVQVLRNAFRMQLRTSKRRRAREEAAPPPDETPSAETSLARLQLQRVVAALVAELDEPYRHGVVLRYFEERSPPEIARRLGVPEGTARWRVSEGLRRLRLQLDREEGPRRWRAVLAPLAVEARPSRPIPAPCRAAGLVAGAGLLCAGVASVRAPAPREPRVPPTTTGRLSSPSPAPNPKPEIPRPNQEDTMKSSRKAQLAAFLSIGVPALVAHASGSNAAPPPQAIDACVEFKVATMKCKAQVADYFATFAPADRREQAKARTIKELESEGSGPLAARQAKCARDLEGASFSDAEVSALRACGAKRDCNAVVACAQTTFEEWRKRAKQGRASAR